PKVQDIRATDKNRPKTLGTKTLSTKTLSTKTLSTKTLSTKTLSTKTLSTKTLGVLVIGPPDALILFPLCAGQPAMRGGRGMRSTAAASFNDFAGNPYSMFVLPVKRDVRDTSRVSVIKSPRPWGTSSDHA